MNDPERSFHLAIKHKRKRSDTICYMNSPHGKNSIVKFLKIAVKRSGLQGNVKNHAVRKTSIGRLLDADVAANYVVQLSSHKKWKSLDSYTSASVLHQRKMSHVQCCSEHMEQATSSATSNKLAISTANASTTTSTAPINPPDGSAAKGLFSSAFIGKIEGCSFTDLQPRWWLTQRPKT